MQKHLKIGCLIAVFCTVVVATASAQNSPSVPATPEQGPAGVATTPPWPVLLGARVMLCERNRPVASRVVLVPDAATYLEQISKWSPLGQWPVLFEDDPGTAQFIRGFQPDEVLRVPPTERRLPEELESRQRLATAVAKISFGATDPRIGFREYYEKLGWRPPGFVVTSMDDPAWTAGVALAAGRGLPLVFVDGDFGGPNQELPATRLRELELMIRDGARSTGYEWAGLGDGLDAVAVCRSLPGRCRMDVPVAAQVRLQGRGPGDGPYATMDALCRNDDGQRWGYAGWIFGDEGRAAVMAMSSIFLDRRNIWMFSGYEKEGQWNVYEVSKPAGRLAELGYASLFFETGDADLASWIRLLRGAIPADVLFMNSHGSPRLFHVSGNQRAYPQDIPFSEKPLALQMVHSFSLKQPASPDTVGGRFLDRGVYAYVGSVDEPYLSAFIPPSLVVERLAAGVPFLLAGRYWPGGGIMNGVWKITAIGDPFMQAIPPQLRVIKPAVDAPPIQGGVDLLDLAKAAMAATKTDPMQGAEAIRLLELLGRDKIAVQVWKNIESSDDQPAIAAAAAEVIGSLFREKDWPEFMDAYGRLSRENRSRDSQDMLWHLATPRLNSISDPDTIAFLSAEIREPMPAVDLERLMPHLDRVLGRGAGRAAVQRCLEDESDGSSRKALLALLVKK